jgi:hypothetical protein
MQQHRTEDALVGASKVDVRGTVTEQDVSTGKSYTRTGFKMDGRAWAYAHHGKRDHKVYAVAHVLPAEQLSAAMAMLL